MTNHLENKDYVRWTKKMVSNPRTRDNMKLCAFHNDYGHLTMECHQSK